MQYGGFEGLLPWSVTQNMAKSNLEYFAWDKFQKVRSAGAFCLSKPDLPDLVVRTAVETIAKLPVRPEEADLGMNDTWRVCHCEECTKPIRLADGSLLEMKGITSERDPVFRSTQYFLFMNKVAERWHKALPDVQLATLGYIYTAEPPLCDLSPHLRVLFAPYPTNNERLPLLDPDQDKTWRTRYATWLKKTPHLGFYQYFWPNMRHLAKSAAADLRELQKIGGDGMVSELPPDTPVAGEGSPNPLSWNWDINPMEAWVINRLYWDPGQDVDALRHYYVRRAFREAAPAMEKYYALLFSGLEDPKDKSFTNCHSPDRNVFRMFIVNKNLEKRCREALNEAERLAVHPNSLQLIQHIRQRFDAIADSLGRIFLAPVPDGAPDAARFESSAWAKVQKLDNFRIIDCLAIYGRTNNAPTEGTTVQALHDDRNFYFRFTALDKTPSQATAASADASRETWPRGDHLELYLAGARTNYVFAFDCNGGKYDAVVPINFLSAWDRNWNSQWSLRVRRTDAAWEAIAVIPMADIGFRREAGGLSAGFVREYNHGMKFPEETGFNGNRPGKLNELVVQYREDL